MKSVDEMKNKIRDLQGQKEFFESLSPDVQMVNLNISRINLINEQIILLNWTLEKDKPVDIKTRLVQALDDFGVGFEMYDEPNDKLADYLIEVIDELK